MRRMREVFLECVVRRSRKQEQAPYGRARTMLLYESGSVGGPTGPVISGPVMGPPSLTIRPSCVISILLLRLGASCSLERRFPARIAAFALDRISLGALISARPAEFRKQRRIDSARVSPTFSFSPSRATLDGYLTR